MELTHVTSILLITMAMTLAVSYALPSPLWDNETPEEDNTQFGSDPNINKLRMIMALNNWPRQRLLNRGFGQEDTSRSKRMDFGFAGLDNIDHIMSTLDRKEANSYFTNNAHLYPGLNKAELIRRMKQAGR